MRIKLGIPMTLGEIAAATKGRIINNASATIKYITTDSREAQKEDLFIPIKGEKFDGENFLLDATVKGCFTLSKKHIESDILVENASAALLDLASFYSKNLPYILYRIGITGSVGKTTTKEFTKVLLSKGYKVHANEGNFNNEIGLPMSLLSAPYDSEILVMEMGMNHLGEIARLSECLSPDMAVITNIGTAHIGNLGSRENIAKAKLEIGCGMNGGSIFVPFEEELLQGEKNRVTLSLSDTKANYCLEEKDSIVSIYENGKKYAEARFAFTEEHLKKCLLFAASIAINCGISPNLLSQGISDISAENIRQNIILLKKRLFYTDFYNASPESITASFDSVQKIEIEASKNLLLGDVLELGKMSKEIHFQIGKSIPEGLFKNLFLFGNFAKFVADGAKSNGFPIERIHINTDLSRPDITASQVLQNSSEGELILMKASRGVRLERVLDYFKERS